MLALHFGCDGVSIIPSDIFYPIQFITAIVDWHLIWSQLTKSQSKF